MDVKNSFIGIKNCRKINTELLHDSLSINREADAIVYAKFTENSDCELVIGNIGAMICAIAEMIILMSKNSGFPISAIIKSIINAIYGTRGGEL